MINPKRFLNKKALITGANGGIGSVLVDALRMEGAIVAVTDLNTSELKADAKFEGDLLDSNFCDELPKKVFDTFKGIDILCNVAGVITRGKIDQATDHDYNLTMKVNVEAPFRLCRATIPLMKNGGAIVNVSSCWGLRPGPSHPLYVMSKAAIASLTQCLGLDHAHQGIRVNGVCPNEVNTNMIKSGFELRGLNPEKAINELNKTIPLGRIAEPNDIVDVILFLLSDESRYICGSLIEVNGAKPVI
tara:strand:- start:1075 stop:1812 length:738 start_codon:yes stop_codon:yes gene_type:complete